MGKRLKSNHCKVGAKKMLHLKALRHPSFSTDAPTISLATK
jgi:hypothetical protein